MIDTPPLSFTHILQTELSRQMNALQQGLHIEPSLPQGFPAWWPIAAASQIPTQALHCLPEVSKSNPLLAQAVLAHLAVNRLAEGRDAPFTTEQGPGQMMAQSEDRWRLGNQAQHNMSSENTACIDVAYARGRDPSSPRRRSRG